MFSIRAICLAGFTLVAITLFGIQPARADDTPAPQTATPAVPQIPDSVKQSVTLSHEQVQAIDDALTQLTTSLADGSNPTAQSADRVWIEDAIHDSGNVPGSDDYLQHYLQSLNTHLLAMISAADANFRAKLEAGLAAQHVAEHIPPPSVAPLALVPLASKLLQDPSPAVTWAGMKAARGLIPAVFSQTTLSAADTSLVDEMVAAVARQIAPPLGGPIADEAYQALLQPVLHPSNGELLPPVEQVLVPAVIKLQQQRLQVYQDAVPENPQADSTGIIILLSPSIWPTLTPQQQHQALQSASDLITQTAKWAKMAKGDAKSGIDPAPLVEALYRTGRELRQFSDPGKGISPNQALFDATAQLAALGSGSSVSRIDSASTSAVSAITNFVAQAQ